MPSISQRQTLRLQQSLSPQQIQAIRLLELPAMQFEQRVKREIEENPVLEEEANEDEENKDISVEEYLSRSDELDYRNKSQIYLRDEGRLTAAIVGGRSLHEYLLEQLGCKELTEREMAIARFLVGSIDDDGYLHRDLESVADDMAFTLGMETDKAELERVLDIIHELEPAGIGSRDLKECLILQLRSLSSTPERKLAMRILTDHFNEFTKKHFDRLMSKLGVKPEKFRAAIDEITALSPRPGNLYDDESSEQGARYVTPDFLLDEHGGEFSLHLNSYNIPGLRVSKPYMEMLRASTRKKNASQADKETMQFIKGKIEAAKWFIEAVRQRHYTLLRTMSEILDFQRPYFESGDLSKLKPMILKDIAERAGFDISTISRVVNSKYVQTPWGVVLLKDLFSEGMETDDRGEVSSYEIKKILREAIDGESKRDPLNDDVLTEIITGKGYHVARRTVTKYRETMGIPVARLRKEL